MMLAFPVFADDNIFRAQFTSQIKDKEPVDALTDLSTAYTSVYFFSDIRDCVGCRIEHRWYRNGDHVYTLKGDARFARYRWWSKKTLTDDLIGTWRVDVVINGKVRVSRTLKYHKPASKVHKVAPLAPIQQRLESKENDQCEEKLEYFNQMTIKEPANPYYKFMLNKWGDRCYGGGE